MISFQSAFRSVCNGILIAGLLFSSPVAVAQDYESSGGGEGGSGQRQTRKASAINAKIFEKFAAAQEAMQADDWPGAERILNEIKAKPKLSSAEAMQLQSMYGILYYSQERYQESIKAFKAILAIPDIEERQRTETLYTLAQLYFTVEDWDRAINIMQDWLKAVENPPPGPFILLASAYYQVERYAEMIEPIETAMRIARERDKPIKEQWWLLLRVPYYQMGNNKEVVRILEILVVNWPKKEYWTMLSGMYGELNFEGKQLAAYESAYDQEFLTNGKELVAFSQLLLQAEAPYKAAKIVQEGLDSGVIEKSVSNYRLASQAWHMAAEYEKAILPLKEASAISEDGELDVRLANSYLNLSRYEECARYARAGLKRGGLKRSATAQEMLGMCLFELDQYDEAIKAFRQAAKDEKIEKRARNWVKFIQSEKARLEALNASIDRARQAQAARQARLAEQQL
jgi:tetratricopeptide (TPR) repeat protein